MGLLGEMLQVLKDEYSAADSEQILCILRALSQSSRFSLSVTFLSQTEKQTVRDCMLLSNPYIFVIIFSL